MTETTTEVQRGGRGRQAIRVRRGEGGTWTPTPRAARFFEILDSIDWRMTPEQRAAALDQLDAEVRVLEVRQAVAAARKSVDLLELMLGLFEDPGCRRPAQRKPREELLALALERSSEAEGALTTVVEVLRSYLELRPCPDRQAWLNLARQGRNYLRAAHKALTRLTPRPATA